MGRYRRAWIIPWEPGQIGVGYTTTEGQCGMREFRWNDPEAAELHFALSDEDRIKLEQHFERAAPVHRRGGTVPH